MPSTQSTQLPGLSASAGISCVQNEFKGNIRNEIRPDPSHASQPGIIHCTGTATASDPETTLLHEAGSSLRRSLHNRTPRLATIRDSTFDRSRDVGTNRPSPTCTGDKTQVTSGLTTERLANSAGRVEPGQTPYVKSTKAEGGYPASNDQRSDTHQLFKDRLVYTSQTIQGFGLLVVLQSTNRSSMIPVKAISENSQSIIGRSPNELLSLESFTSIIEETQTDEFVARIDLIRSEETDVPTNRFEPFTVWISTPEEQILQFWCVMHQAEARSDLFICEFELHEDKRPIPCSPGHETIGNVLPERTAKTVQAQNRRPRGWCSEKRVLDSSNALGVLNTLSQVQEQLATASNVGSLLEIAASTVKRLTGFHRVMTYQFDHNFNARVVTELADAQATTVAYIGRTFAASEFPKQFRDLHQLNRVRMLYDRDIDNARIVCRASQSSRHPVNLTYSYLRAISHNRLKCFAKLAVRSSISISLNAFNQHWGLLVCHAYGSLGMRASFPVRKMCYLLSDMVSRNIERLSYVSRMQARSPIDTLPTSRELSGFNTASSETLLKLVNADFGILSVGDRTRVFGLSKQPQDALVVLTYLRMKNVTSVLTSTNLEIDFSELRCPFSLHSIGGVLVVPLSVEAGDFVVFFRNSHLNEPVWAVNLDDALVDGGTEGPSELRRNSKAGRVTIANCKEWTEEEVEIASVFSFIYAKLIAVCGHDEAVLQSNRLTQLLLENSAHEIRTPLNAVVNYLELALEGALEEVTRQCLKKSQHASKSLLHFTHEMLRVITPLTP